MYIVKVVILAFCLVSCSFCDSLDYSFWTGNSNSLIDDTLKYEWNFGAEFEFFTKYLDFSIVPYISLLSNTSSEIQDINLDLTVYKKLIAYQFSIRTDRMNYEHFIGLNYISDIEELGTITRVGTGKTDWLSDGWRLKIYFQAYFKQFDKNGAPPYFEVWYDVKPWVKDDVGEVGVAFGLWGKDLFKRIPIIGDIL